MNVVLLTTDTTHHLYFAWQLSQQFPLRAIVLETSHIDQPFETAHPFETLRDQYEEDTLLADCQSTLSDIAETHSFNSMNDSACVAELQKLAPEITIVFGTSRLKPPVIEVASYASLNLHGGNPEEYRGLDTHLWSIYHNDWANLVTTLHFVDPNLDTGDIAVQSQVPLHKDIEFHQVRAINTEVCVELVSCALNSFRSAGRIPRRRQLKRGRYYSFMPSALKEICLHKFNRHISKL